jgi:hypothetical protein
LTSSSVGIGFPRLKFESAVPHLTQRPACDFYLSDLAFGFGAALLAGPDNFAVLAQHNRREECAYIFERLVDARTVIASAADALALPALRVVTATVTPPRRTLPDFFRE